MCTETPAAWCGPSSCCPPCFDRPLCGGYFADVLYCLACVEGHDDGAALCWCACVGTGGAFCVFLVQVVHSADQCTVHGQLFLK